MPRVHFANTELPAENIQMHDIQEQYNTPQDHDMLRISPQDYLRFTKGDDKECTLELVNISKSPVTYKIQTTSPEKFRVRPRCGILNSGDTIQVSILLKQEHNLSENSKDKFLIMCLPANDATPSNLAEFWKKAGSTAANVEQHRVCCIYNESHVAGAGGAGGATTVGNGYVGAQGVGDKRSMPQTQNTADVTKKLENQLKNTQILQIITLAFLILLSIAVGYLLKVQLCGDDSCFQSDNLSARTSSDFGSCVKGKTDL